MDSTENDHRLTVFLSYDIVSTRYCSLTCRGGMQMTKSHRSFSKELITAFGALYLTFVFLGKKIAKLLYEHLARSVYPCYPVIFLFVVFFCILCFVGLKWLSRNVRKGFTHYSVKEKLSFRFWGIVTLAFFFLHFAYLMANYPGGYSPDGYDQMQQAHTMVFNDHHPFFHTWLFRLLTRIRDSYPFMLTVQAAAFALAVGYLAATLHAWGFSMPLIFLLLVFIEANAQTRVILLHFWKDTTMSILLLILLSHIINIFLTNGMWLRKWHHWLSSAILLAAITLVRHNAVLFTAPLLVLMFLFLPKVRLSLVKTTLLVLALIVGVKGPLQSFYQVQPASDTYLEIVGVPMTVLFSVYQKSAGTMPDDAREFVESFGSRSEIIQHFNFGDFNSVKWALNVSQERLDKTPPKDLLKITWETVKSNSVLSALSFLELTDFVWEPADKHYQYLMPLYPTSVNKVPSSFPQVMGNIKTGLYDFFRLLDEALSIGLIQKPIAQLGVLMLVMILALYISICNFHGWKSLWLVLPILCYNFGTMLLLCGSDYRFFHFNCLMVYPLTMLLLIKPQVEK